MENTKYKEMILNFVEKSIETNNIANVIKILWSYLYIQGFKAKNQNDFETDFLERILGSEITQNKIQSDANHFEDQNLSQANQQLRDYYKAQFYFNDAILSNNYYCEEVSYLKDALIKQNYIKNSTNPKLLIKRSEFLQEFYGNTIDHTSITYKNILTETKIVVYLPKNLYFCYDDLYENGFYLIDIFIAKILSGKFGKKIVFFNHLELELMRDSNNIQRIIESKFA